MKLLHLKWNIWNHHHKFIDHYRHNFLVSVQLAFGFDFKMSIDCNHNTYSLCEIQIHTEKYKLKWPIVFIFTNHFSCCLTVSTLEVQNRLFDKYKYVSLLLVIWKLIESNKFRKFDIPMFENQALEYHPKLSWHEEQIIDVFFKMHYVKYV